MDGAGNWRTIVAVAMGGVLFAVAGLSAWRFLGGPAQRFQQHRVTARTTRQIDSTTRELLALASNERLARLRELAGPDAPSQTLHAVAEALERMEEAANIELVATDGYGPKLVKAIYDLTYDDGGSEQVAFTFEKNGDGTLALLDAAP